MVKVVTNKIASATSKSTTSALPSRSGSTQKMAANIKVVVRVRPPNEKEIAGNHRIAIDVVDKQMLIFDPKDVAMPFFYQGVQQPNRNFLKRPNKELKFVFDHVCDQRARNNDVFEATTKEMLSYLMEGYNCSVFAYGATGAGKTFTMIGCNEEPGITYLTMDSLFSMFNSYGNDREFNIAVSYIEVYNENVYDLLHPSKTPLHLREDGRYDVTVSGLTLHTINTSRELLNLLENGNKNRTQHPTDANAESSRSHAVFQVYVNMRNKTSSEHRLVKLSMIDLAGSERASATGCVGDRFKEGANINRSLLSLGNCINRLADGGSYIPYRDSKLTRLLKDSLGGNCKTVMIANISPSHLSYEDTYNTLKYASRANKIQLSIKKNIVDGSARVSQYVKINEELIEKVKLLEARLAQAQTVQIVERKPDTRIALEWRQRIGEFVKQHSVLESMLLNLMSRERVLALRHRLRQRAFAHVADLAHRSSSDAMEQMCTEDIPRQERAAESYINKAQVLNKKITSLCSKWKQSKEKLENLLNQSLSEESELNEFINNIKIQTEKRQTQAENELRLKLLTIQNDEINAFSNYMVNMPSMLKKLYLMLKGYEKVTPSLTTEYLNVMKTAKSGKAITWSDKDSDSDFDDNTRSPFFKLDLENPSSISEMAFAGKLVNDNNGTFSCEEMADVENIEPVKLSARKRKVAPLKIQNDTIVIDDSVDEILDLNRTMSGKKIKIESSKYNKATDNENYEVIDPSSLNSTFVLAGKLEGNNKDSANTTVVKKGLSDRTNFMPKTINFNDKAKVVKPVALAAPFRRPTVASVSAVPRSGFGSTVGRGGASLARNVQEKSKQVQKFVGFKAVRARERVQALPYSRSTGRNLPSKN